MIYRIRFRQSVSAREAEVVVEANSPNEAMVKFQCTRQEHHATSRSVANVVTSVCADEPQDCMPW